MTSVTELIGNDYQNWGRGDIVTISTSTGSGKTSFVLFTLLEHAIYMQRNSNLPGNNIGILYLVNRKVLKEQLQIRISTEVTAWWSSRYPNIPVSSLISVRTYQEIEDVLKRGAAENLYKQMAQFNITVYDECHYFMVDSVFNPATYLSWTHLTHVLSNTLQVFMSATIDSMKANIEQLKNRSKEDCHPLIFQHRMAHKCIYNYPEHKESISNDYDYVDLYSIDSDDELPSLIQKGDKKAKWLIFVDSINKGKKLLSRLKKTEGENNVIFIYAKYKNDLEAYERVIELKLKASISRRIVIATSVMDNGISFRDTELQNVVIFADMKEPFIQMLGRKRRDNNRINVYICKRNSSYFSARIRNIDETLQFLGRYEPAITRIMELSYPEAKPQPCQDNQDEMYVQDLQNQQPSYNRPQPVLSYRVERQQGVLSDLLDNEEVRKNLKRFCFISCGMIMVSQFAIQRLSNMRNYYATMKEKIEKDENAFLYMQASWLGFDENTIKHKLRDAQKKKNLLAFSSICEEIEKYLGKSLTTKEKADLSDDIRYYLQMLLVPENNFNEDELKALKSALRTDRAVSVDTFNCITKKFPFSLPYIMRRPQKSIFIIEKRHTAEKDMSIQSGRDNFVYI